MERKLHIATNFEVPAEFSFEGVSFSGLGEGVLSFVKKCLTSDVVVLNIDQKKLMLAAMLRRLPFVKFRLVSVDLVLRQPKTPFDRFKATMKKIVLSGVDRFVLYFKNIDGYKRWYGIDSNRVAYVPFKVNSFERIAERSGQPGDGEYVLCAGRTLRDVETFVEAMRVCDCPGVLLQQRRDLLNAHGSRSWSGELPLNVQLVIDEGDSFEDFVDQVAKARLVVIPRFKHDIAPTGISTYLLAMALNKCVIISEGPGAEDVLTDQAVIIPPENAERLAEVIESLWNNDQLRSEVAARGYGYAMFLRGYDRLLIDILRVGLNHSPAAATIPLTGHQSSTKTMGPKPGRWPLGMRTK